MKKFRFHVDIWRSPENAAAPREQRISLIHGSASPRDQLQGS